MVGDGLIESIFNRKVRAIAKGHSGNCTAKKKTRRGKTTTHSLYKKHLPSKETRRRHREASLKDFSMVFCFLLQDCHADIKDILSILSLLMPTHLNK